jgi:LacI family transcriptional regulator
VSTRSTAATIVDVARLAGVSIKTVSRVVNQEPGVHEHTRAQVMKAVEALRYRPQQSARSLAGGRSFLIGLLYYDPSAAFVGSVQQGATLRCRELGCHLVVESLHNDAPDLKQQVERMVMALRPDGMILAPPLCDNADVLAALSETGTPCVQMSPARDTPGLPSLRMDDRAAAAELTRRLIERGHRRIAFVQGPPEQSASALRLRGYREAMAGAGLEVDPAWIRAGDFRFESGRAAAQALLALEPRPTAVFASNDDMALGVLAAAQAQGLRLPQALSVVGFDDAPAAELVWPALTTVRQPIAAMARLAVDLIVQARRAGHGGALAEHQVLPHALIERNSVADA